MGNSVRFLMILFGVIIGRSLSAIHRVASFGDADAATFGAALLVAICFFMGFMLSELTGREDGKRK